MRQKTYVREVVDGDSFKTTSDEMRLEGVEAPEYNSESGRKAKNKLKELIENRNIEYEEKARDDYRRLVVQVWVDGKNVNDAMNRFLENL